MTQSTGLNHVLNRCSHHTRFSQYTTSCHNFLVPVQSIQVVIFLNFFTESIKDKISFEVSANSLNLSAFIFQAGLHIITPTELLRTNESK